MKSRGRPRVAQIQLKNGFYIEVCDKGMKKGMKIRSDSKQAMEDAASQYNKYKDVIILGEYKSGVPFTEIPVS
jgi:hypothetical protein